MALSIYDPKFKSVEELADKLEYRYSSLKLFQQCPKQFELRYILEADELSNGIEAFVGSQFHSAAEDLHNLMINGMTLMTLDEFIDRFFYHWNKNYDPDFIRNVMGKPLDYYIGIGVESAENYYLENYPFNSETDIACELELQIEINEYLLNMHIDRVSKKGDVIYIHDYKTSNKLPSKAELNQSLQLSIYEMGIRQHFNHDGPVVLVWHYVRHNKRYECVRSEQSIEKTKAEIVKIISEVEEAIEFNHFPYRPNFKCDWCPYAINCDSYLEQKEGKL